MIINITKKITGNIPVNFYRTKFPWPTNMVMTIYEGLDPFEDGDLKIEYLRDGDTIKALLLKRLNARNISQEEKRNRNVDIFEEYFSSKKSMTEIGKEYGLTGGRVKQILEKLIRVTRHLYFEMFDFPTEYVDRVSAKQKSASAKAAAERTIATYVHQIMTADEERDTAERAAYRDSLSPITIPAFINDVDYWKMYRHFVYQRCMSFMDIPTYKFLKCVGVVTSFMQQIRNRLHVVNPVDYISINGLVQRFPDQRNFRLDMKFLDIWNEAVLQHFLEQHSAMLIPILSLVRAQNPEEIQLQYTELNTADVVISNKNADIVRFVSLKILDSKLVDMREEGYYAGVTFFDTDATAKTFVYPLQVPDDFLYVSTEIVDFILGPSIEREPLFERWRETLFIV